MVLKSRRTLGLDHAVHISVVCHFILWDHVYDGSVPVNLRPFDKLRNVLLLYLILYVRDLRYVSLDCVCVFFVPIKLFPVEVDGSLKGTPGFGL